ncbi:DNA methyltransferase [Thermomonas sp.]|uniref:DNA methyltransferase n=1 Tax=Thermomonas sp. TaxID=1971895 RepID=UPI0035B46A81
MPLSLNEIRERARAFAREWAGESSERAEAQSFWNDFFEVFGVKRKRVAVFEQKAARFTGSTHGRIDVFWPGVMLAEHKSEGRDLDAAFEQATDYFAGLKDAELPRFVLVSDFQRLRLHDLDTGERTDFALADLHRQIGRFGFISGYQTRSYKEEDPVNVQAAERMGKLHDALKAAGFDGHALELLLVRLLFCLFADDTGIFPRQSFHDLISQRTSEDGADLGMWIGRAFQVLNTAPEKRQSTLDEQLAELPYVNGKLFEEILPLADFNAQMRGLLLDASALDWSRISPAIFGSMFQSVMDTKARRNLGAHYTSEKNILKLIGPLFLDGLKAELDKAGHDERKLAQLHRKLATLTFLDPACGCGNFLVIAYRELRALELEILRRQFATQQSVLAHVQDHVLVDVDQFHGIEIEEFPAQIAQVAMWLMDHQMNSRMHGEFGEPINRIPLKKSATIVHGNALRMDWNAVVPAERLSFILGNPPFVGKKEQNADQKADMAAVFAGVKGAGVLDFVCAWYLKAADYMQRALARHSRAGGNPRTSASDTTTSMDSRLRGNDGLRAAFVSTNSITQGEQVGILWSELYQLGMHIQFAHRTFKWSNEARGKAAVHCVIVGFGGNPSDVPALHDYERADGESQLVEARRINPYLVDAPEVFLTKRSVPLSAAVPAMNYGSMPIDEGHLILSDEERETALADEPGIEPWIRPYFGGDEFINAGSRWCLWLLDAPPSVIKQSPFLRLRIEACRAFRAGSGRATTRELSKTPGLFGEIRQPTTRYLLLPKVSSENRAYIPCGFLDPEAIASGTGLVVAGAGLYDFGIITSQMHMAWMRAVAGRLESRYQYSAGIVYNNFPWPEPLDDKARAGIEAAAQAILDARAQFPGSTLADLYDPLTMPPALVKAHAALDKAVDAAYLTAEKAAGRKPPKLTTDAERVAFLFERYQALTRLLPADKPKRARKPQVPA